MCSPTAVENQDANGARPAVEEVYDGVLFRRGNLVVSDLDRAFKVWIDRFRMDIDTENVPDPDSLSYDRSMFPTQHPRGS